MKLTEQMRVTRSPVGPRKNPRFKPYLRKALDEEVSDLKNLHCYIQRIGFDYYSGHSEQGLQKAEVPTIIPRRASFLFSVDVQLPPRFKSTHLLQASSSSFVGAIACCVGAYLFIHSFTSTWAIIQSREKTSILSLPQTFHSTQPPGKATRRLQKEK